MKHEGRNVRPFAEFLDDQGTTHQDVSVALADLVDAVVQFGKPGHLVLKLTVRPASKNADDGVVMVSDQITVKAPAGDRAQRVFFALPGGGLSRKDPRQMELSDILPAHDENGEVLP